MKFIGFLMVMTGLWLIGITIGALLGWFAVDVVGGHALSFRESVGLGILLNALVQANVNVNS